MRLLPLVAVTALVMFAYPAAILHQSLAPPAAAQSPFNLPPRAAPAQPAGLGLCTGSKDGVYFTVGDMLREAGGKSLPIDVLTTEGSWENLLAVADGSKCQAAIVQGDAIVAFQRTHGAEARAVRRVATLHTEYVHMLCNRKGGVSNGYDLMDDSKHPLAVGADGSGGWITVQNWIALDKGFGKVPLLPEGGVMAAGSTADGAKESPACMLFVAGLKSPLVNKIDDGYGDQLVMVDVTGKLFRNALDDQGKPLYAMATVPSDAYRRLMPSGFLGRSSVEVPSMPAVLVVNREKLGEDRWKALGDVVARARSRIVALGALR